MLFRKAENFEQLVGKQNDFVLNYCYLKCEEMNFYEIISDGYIQSNISGGSLRRRKSTGALSIKSQNES
ncbi:hypothetical protein GCM10019993_02920 [Enterococcus pseudoavium]